MHSNDDKRIKATADFWSRKTGKPVSKEDAREINANISGFFSVLRGWDEKERRSAAHDDSIAGVSQIVRNGNG